MGSRSTFLEKNHWREVRVPHDWLTELPYDPDGIPSAGYKKREKGWYYISFQLPDQPIENARLVFEGVLGQTEIFVNGTVAGRNHSGYNRFSCEIASYLLPGGENMIALYVDASTREGWSYEGAGLYRPAYIEFREAVRLDWDGCFVRGRNADGNWEVVADLSAAGTDEADGNEIFAATLRDPDGRVIGQKNVPLSPRTAVTFPVNQADVWNPEHPALYSFTCELKRGEDLLDSRTCAVGLRRIEWKADAGMLLNGERYRIKGICCHQDHGGVGAAVSPQLMEYRVRRLKEFGINAYRCAHHAMPESFLEICDRVGMLAMVENRHYSVSEDALKQLESLVRQSRNHPCVFLYSLFNEEPWQADRRGYRMAKQMRDLVLSLDDTRAVTGAMNGGTLTDCNASDALDVIGINYHMADYEKTHLRSPDKVILGTENCPTYATRGEYVTDKARQVFNCYGDEWASHFSESMTDTMERVEKTPYVAGCFVWSGLDSYGEPVPHLWPSVTSHWGILDVCGFAKDTAYLLEAWYKEELCAHLLPHWNWAEGETVRVCVFTNADTAELFVNGRSRGEIAVKERRAEWNVPFEPGKIRVRACRGGAEIFDGIRTAGAPARLILEDVTPKSKRHRIRILNVSVTDAEGIRIRDFDGTVSFDPAGIEILGVANGNPNGTQPLAASEIALFHGRAQLIVTSDSRTVTARCDGLPDVSI